MCGNRLQTVGMDVIALDTSKVYSLGCASAESAFALNESVVDDAFDVSDVDPAFDVNSGANVDAIANVDAAAEVDTGAFAAENVDGGRSGGADSDVAEAPAWT